MLQSLGLGFVFRAKDEMSETVEKLHGGVDRLGEAGEQAHKSLFGALKMSGTAIAGISAALGAAAIGAAFEFAEKADDFSHALREAGVAAHATTEELEKFEAMAKHRALGQLRDSAMETATALAELTKEGFNLTESGQAVDATLDLMYFSSLGARQAAGLVHDTLAEFGMQATQSREVVDKLAYAMREFHFRAEELAPSMNQLASGAALTHSSFDDVLIGVGLLKQVFPSATRAAGAMNIALQQLSSTTAQKELRGIGVSVKDAHGKMLPLLNVMQTLIEKTKHMTEAQLSNKLATIGSARAAGGLITIIDALKKGVTDAEGRVLTGGAALEYYRKQLNDTQGTAKRMADLLGDDMAGSMKALRGAIGSAAVALGGMFEGGFKTAVQDANIAVRGLVQLFTEGGFSGDVGKALEKHSGIKSFVIGVFLAVKRIQNFFSELGASFQAAFEPFRPALDSLIEAFGFLGHELGLTGQTAGDNASKFDAFGEAGSNLGTVIGELAGSLLPILKTIVLAVAGAVIFAKQEWEIFGDTITSVWGIIAGAVHAIGSLLSGDWKGVWDGFVDIVKNAALSVVHILMGIVGTVAKTIDGIGSVFGKDWDHAGMIKDLQKDWEGNIKFGANELKSVVPSAPAEASRAAMEGQAKANGAALMSMMPEPHSSGASEVHSHVTLRVDGEKLAEAHARAKRSAGAREFRSVPAESGAF